MISRPFYQQGRIPASRFTRNLRCLVAGALAFAIMLSACGSDSTNAAQESDGTLVAVMPDQALQLSFDAGWTSSKDFYDMQLAIHATLIRKPYIETDQAGVYTQDLYSFEGVLAESVEYSDDGRTATFHLREGVISQAGNELTADDVIWSYERKFGSPTSITPYVVAPGLTDPSAQFEKIDDYTVSLTVPSAGMLFTTVATMADISGQIYDSTYLQEHATPDDPWATEWSSDVYDFGFGAYKIESISEGSETVLVANPDYALGEPEIKRIIRRVVPDAGNRVAALQNGDADIDIAPRSADQAELAQSSDFTIPTVPTNFFLMVNPNVQADPFTDSEVRRALAYAIDYEQIIQDIYHGRAVQANFPLQPDAPGFVADGLPEWTYDPEQALSILEDAGYSDGVGFTLTVGTSEPVLQDVAVSIQSSAEAAGFDIEIEALAPTQFAEKTQTGGAEAVLGTGSAITLSPSYELNLWTAPGATTNLSQWENEEFYGILAQASELPDPFSDEAGLLWNQAQQVWLSEDVAMVYVARMFPAVSMRSNVTGWGQRTDGAAEYAVMSIE